MPLYLWFILLVVLPATCSALMFLYDFLQNRPSDWSR